MLDVPDVPVVDPEVPDVAPDVAPDVDPDDVPDVAGWVDAVEPVVDDVVWSVPAELPVVPDVPDVPVDATCVVDVEEPDELVWPDDAIGDVPVTACEPDEDPPEFRDVLV